MLKNNKNTSIDSNETEPDFFTEMQPKIKQPKKVKKIKFLIFNLASLL